jgi:two-component system response regulator FlrC
MLIRHGGEHRHFTVSEHAQKLLLSYAWPGNVRELDNVVQRAVVLCQGDCVEAQHLMFDDLAALAQANAPMVSGTQASNASESSHFSAGLIDGAADSDESVDQFAHVAHQIRSLPADNLHAAVKSNELQLIMAAIESTDSRIEAARKLGISPRTLRYKLAKFKVKPEEQIAPANLNMAYAIGG